MREEKVIFTGSAMDGIYGENLVSWCGLSLSDEDQDKISESINEIDLLMRCPSIDYMKKMVLTYLVFQILFINLLYIVLKKKRI